MVDLIVQYQEFILPLLSLSTPIISEPSVRIGISWSVNIFLIYLISLNVYGKYLDLPVKNWRLTAIFVITAAGTGAVFTILSDILNPYIHALVILFVSLIFYPLFVFHIISHEQTEQSRYKISTSIIRQFDFGSQKAKISDENVDIQFVNHRTKLNKNQVSLILAAAILWFPAVLSLFVIPIYNLTFPFPDIFLLIGAIGYRARNLSNFEIPGNIKTKLDLTTYLRDIIHLTTYNIKSWALTTFVLGGIFVNATAVWHASSWLSLLPEPDTNRILSASTAPEIITIWGFFGFVVVLYIAGGYGIWAWILQLRRIEPFVEYWENTRAEKLKSGELLDFLDLIWPYKQNESLSTNNRAPYFVLIPSVIVYITFEMVDLLTTFSEISVDYGQDFQTSLLFWIFFGLMWLIFLVLLISPLLSNYDREHHLFGEDVIIFGGLLLQLAAFGRNPTIPVPFWTLALLFILGGIPLFYMDFELLLSN